MNASEPERATQACLLPNAIGENADEPQVRRAHSVRTGERGRARAGGASLLAAERDWRERRMCDDTFAVAVDLTHLKTKHVRASLSGRATSSTGALGARRRTRARTQHVGEADGRDVR